MVKEGGIQEILDQQEESQSKYLFSVYLLQALVNPTDLAPITSKFAQIKLENPEIIKRYIQSIQDRLEI